MSPLGARNGVAATASEGDATLGGVSKVKRSSHRRFCSASRRLVSSYAVRISSIAASNCASVILASTVSVSAGAFTPWLLPQADITSRSNSNPMHIFVICEYLQPSDSSGLWWYS